MTYISREAAIDAIWKPEVRPNALIFDALRRACEEEVKHIPSADVVEVVRGEWEKVGEQMLINLENAREQYAELGYPHRKILNLRCSSCRKVTMVDSSIAYDFCPHCGADMREVKVDG